MKLKYVYCYDQHLHAVKSVLDEMQRRGHEVSLVEKNMEDFKNTVVIDDVDCLLTSYSILIKKIEMKKGKKICIEHGINPIRSVFPHNNGSYRRFDHILCSGKWWVERAGDVKGICTVTGFPKSDELVSMRENRQEITEMVQKKMNRSFSKNHPIIVWVPSHSGAWPLTPKIVEQGIPNLVIAPHELTYRHFRSWKYNENYPYYIETANVNEILAIADVVITDFSSAGFEALAIEDIPVIQILSSTGKSVNENAVERGYYVTKSGDRKLIVGANIRDVSLLKKEIEKAYADKVNYYKEERDFWRSELLHDCGNVVENCCDSIESFCSNSPQN